MVSVITQFFFSWSHMGFGVVKSQSLTLDSIDWKKEQLFVPGRKAGHSTVYPLSTVVGEAVLDYLHTRPQTTDRHISSGFLPR